MSHYLITEPGKYLGDVATNTGLGELYTWLEGIDDGVAEGLVADGHADAGELYQLILQESPTAVGQGLQATLENLLSLLEGIEGEVLITDGSDDEEGEPDDLQERTEQLYADDDEASLWDHYG